MELKPTDHKYYCSDSNYYVDGHQNHGLSEYANWADFKMDWLGTTDDPLWLDDDYNHLFRFDIGEARDDETDEPLGNFSLYLYFILQRKGIFRPVWIKELTEADMPEVEEFLKRRWEYMQGQWVEFSGVMSNE